MKQLTFEITGWLHTTSADPAERETLASLQITAGPNSVPVTEVQDTIAQTVRRHINVPAHSLARWLVANWWRLRWEPPRESPDLDWQRSHSLAAIGGGYAWPALTLSSDGEFIRLELEPEASPDVSAVRYLRDVTLHVPATDFEQAVDQFVAQVEARLELRAQAERELAELREELWHERQDASLAKICKLQALSGFDPGSAPDHWLHEAESLAKVAGQAAAEEILAVTPSLNGGLADAKAAISAMCASTTTVQLGWASLEHDQRPHGEFPWEHGARSARELRERLDIPRGPVTTAKLGDILDVALPIDATPWTGSRRLRGGFRNGDRSGRTAVLVTSSREDSQRFYLARLVGAALRAPDDQHVLPVSDAATALQKFERSFAQEFLCPWVDLEAFTDQCGTDDDGIAHAAAHFAVSERVVLSTLVNKRKVPRSRLLGS